MLTHRHTHIHWKERESNRGVREQYRWNEREKIRGKNEPKIMGHCASTVHTIKHRPGAESLGNYSPINTGGMIMVTAQDCCARPSSVRKKEELVIEFLLYLWAEHEWEWRHVRRNKTDSIWTHIIYLCYLLPTFI